MIARDRRLLRDPLFQLNTVLWLVTELPRDTELSRNDIRPILRECGYLLRSIAPRLPLPPEVFERLAREVGGDPPSPDVLLVHGADAAMLVVECKASSFGLQATQARQAVKLLAVSSDLSGPLGLPVHLSRAGHLAYLLPGQHAERLVPTLRSLQERLRELGVEPAPASAIGLDRDDRGVVVGSALGDRLPDPAAHALDEPALAFALGPEDDPRPLYLIPWDPSVQQEPDQAEFCRRQLGARILNAMVSRIGRMSLPTTELIRMDELIDEATFGVSRYWRDASAVNRVRQAAQRTITSAIGQADVSLELTAGTSPIHVQLTVTGEGARNAVIEALAAADELGAATPYEWPPPTLFESPGDDG